MAFLLRLEPIPWMDLSQGIGWPGNNGRNAVVEAARGHVPENNGKNAVGARGRAFDVVYGLAPDPSAENRCSPELVRLLPSLAVLVINHRGGHFPVAVDDIIRDFACFHESA